MERDLYMPMRLDMFAEDAAAQAGDADTNAAGAAGGATTGGTDGASEGSAKDGTDNQQAQLTEADYTTMINKIMDERDARRAAEAAEAEKQKGMSPEQLLEQREKAVLDGELRIAARGILSEKGLPVEFAEFLRAGDEETTKKNIDSFEKLFRAKLTEQVNTRLQGDPPPAPGRQQTAEPGDFRSALRSHIEKATTSV